MDKETQKRFDMLPEDIKKAITSSEVPAKLSAIGTKHGLHVDQLGALEEETARVMLGMVHPNEFVDRIENHLDISTDEAIAITKDVNVDIFLSIRDSLMGLHEKEISEAAVEKELVKEDVLKEIENPTSVRSAQNHNLPVEQREAGAISFIHQKMTQATSQPEQKVIVKERPKSYSSDPYREPIA